MRKMRNLASWSGGTLSGFGQRTALGLCGLSSNESYPRRGGHRRAPFAGGRIAVAIHVDAGKRPLPNSRAVTLTHVKQIAHGNDGQRCERLMDGRAGGRGEGEATHRILRFP